MLLLLPKPRLKRLNQGVFIRTQFLRFWAEHELATLIFLVPEDCLAAMWNQIVNIQFGGSFLAP